MDLTPDQNDAFNKIKTNNWDVFILTGHAGSGKTQLLLDLVIEDILTILKDMVVRKI